MSSEKDNDRMRLVIQEAVNLLMVAEVQDDADKSWIGVLIDKLQATLEGDA